MSVSKSSRLSKCNMRMLWFPGWKILGSARRGLYLNPVRLFIFGVTLMSLIDLSFVRFFPRSFELQHQEKPVDAS